MAVKDNQPPLHAELPDAFVQAPAPKPRASRVATTVTHGHGRVERRTVRVLLAQEALSAAQWTRWLGGLSVVRVTREAGDQATEGYRTETSYYLRRLSPLARRIHGGRAWILVKRRG